MEWERIVKDHGKWVVRLEVGSSPPTKEELQECERRNAEEKKRPAATATSGVLPDLSKIKVNGLTVEEKKRAEEEYLRNRAFAEAAGMKLADIETQIAEIETMGQEKIDLTPTLRIRLEELRKARSKILSTDEGVQKHTQFAAYLEEIRRATATGAFDKVNELLEKAVDMSRLQETTPEEAKGKPHMFWHRGKVYRLSMETNANIAMETELWKLIKAAREQRKENYQAAVTRIQASAEPGVTLLKACEEGTLRKVYVYLPGREEELPNGERRKISESHLLLEIDDKGTLKPVEAAGHLRRFFGDLSTQGTYLPIATFGRFLETGRLELAKRLPDDAFKNLLGLAKILRAAMKVQETVEEAVSKVEEPSTLASETHPEIPPEIPKEE